MRQLPAAQLLEIMLSLKSDKQFAPRRAQCLAILFLLTILAFVGFFLFGNLGNVQNGDIYDAFRLHLEQARAEPSKLTVEDSNLSVEDSSHPIVQQKCLGKFVYMYQLPADFNDKLVDRCGRVSNSWLPLCGNLENLGLGPLLPQSLNESTDSFVLKPAKAWFRTEQFSLEVIFHERMKEYSCLTDDPQVADAFYIPYYAALDTAFTLFSPYLHLRDRLTQQLIGWLSGNPVWSKYKQQRHFMVLGRISWDFSRNDKSEHGWGSALLSQPEFENVTKLLIERKTWKKDELGVPYPTAFHPSSDEDVRLWQEELRAGESKREWLFTYVGSTRGSNKSRTLREEISKQCSKEENKSKCKMASCKNWGGGIDCGGRPERVINLFKNSIFCLQPSGDSPTRKGLFDSIVAGCVPVLFSESSAYQQYAWHLPNNGSQYSVYIDGDDMAQGKVDLVQHLGDIVSNKDRLKALQERLIELLPSIVYAHPGSVSSRSKFARDAVDITLDNLLNTSPIPAY